MSLSLNRTRLRPAIMVLFACLSLALTRPATALGTAVPYTGQLLSGTAALNGQYDFQFTLYNAATGGSTVGSTLSKSNLTVANGIFYVELDFGSVYTGTTLYLQTAYRKSGTSTYTTQSPRKLYATSGSTDYAALSGSTQALQGYFVSARTPTTNQVLTWTGTKWQPQTPVVSPAYTAGTGLTLLGTQFSVASGGITNSLLATNSVSNSKLADGSVSNAKLADGSVSNAKIVTNAISNSKLADGSVSNSKIVTNAVSTSKLADSSVTTVKLADGSVTTAKLAGGTLTAKDPDSPVRAPVEGHIFVSNSSSSSFDNLLYTVPAGKELVVENMSIVSDPISNTVGYTCVVLNNDSTGNFVSVASVSAPANVGAVTSATQPMRLHVLSGGSVKVNVFSTDTTINAIVSLSGFLVNAP